MPSMDPDVENPAPPGATAGAPSVEAPMTSPPDATTNPHQPALNEVDGEEASSESLSDVTDDVLY